MRPVNLLFALQGLGTNKLRAALTTLGIIIGVGAVIMIVSMGAGLRRATEREMEALSGGVIDVRAGSRAAPPLVPSSGSAQASAATTRLVPLAQLDVEAVRRLATSVQAVAPQLDAGGRLVWEGRYLPSSGLIGVTSDYLLVYRREMKWGRFFLPADEERANAVAVLEEELVTQFWGVDANPVGETVHIVSGGVTHNVIVVGVLKRRVSITGLGPRTVFVPLRTAQLRFYQGAKDSITAMSLRVDTRVAEERLFAVAQVNTILRARHALPPGSAEDFSVRDTLEFSEEMTRIPRTITLVLSLIAGISLIVGSIGLMNIMLVSVSERTWEIGLRRALGAERRDVLTQFLLEAVLLSLAGGLAGLALGSAGSYAISLFVEQLSGLIWVTPDVVLIALAISSAVGISAGVYPAWQAGLLEPATALRTL